VGSNLLLLGHCWCSAVMGSNLCLFGVNVVHGRVFEPLSFWGSSGVVYGLGFESLTFWMPVVV
jgi:hypothetical protein